jgi:hypothetical protein
MKAAFLLLICTALSVFAIEHNSKTLRACPHGHTTLENVPLSAFDLDFYGRYSTSPPSIEVKCTTCGFISTQYTLADPKPGAWIRTSSNCKSFVRPFSSFIREFPTPPPRQRRGSIEYTQHYVVPELPMVQSVRYITTEPEAELRKRIERFLSSRGLTARFVSDTVEGQTRQKFGWEGNGFDVEVSPDANSSWVNASFGPNRVSGNVDAVKRSP